MRDRFGQNGRKKQFFGVKNKVRQNPVLRMISL